MIRYLIKLRVQLKGIAFDSRRATRETVQLIKVLRALRIEKRKTS